MMGLVGHWLEFSLCGCRRAFSRHAPPRVKSIKPEGVLTVDANAITWQAFVEHYLGKRPVILKESLDLSNWSVQRWVDSCLLSGAFGSEADLVIRGDLNTLSQRGNAELVTNRVTPAEVMAQIFGHQRKKGAESAVGPVLGLGDRAASYWQWRTTLGTLARGQSGVGGIGAKNPVRSGAREKEGGRAGSSTGGAAGVLPPCLPMPRLLREWPGVVVRPDGESAVFLTSAWGRTAMHADDFDNLLCHLHGPKSFVLVAPEWRARRPELLARLFTAPGTHAEIYGGGEAPGGGETGPAGCLGGGVGEREDIRDIRGVPRLRCVLGAGDLLYIPKGWLHDVESQGEATVSAALRFEDPGTLGGGSPDLIFASAFDM
mmetsp:Transcript_43558/g.98465  ORF Transcript_43558/g.98465 Transcript_43558/m.98465 type:complete len:373 (-) Transcript_43558:165-1283(-)|eukprot:CAMPEP_0172637104 /NCGR_PEP_ID=MMETSP1068-20121228/207209_1 /TAXON_ID=35684 /ORGANISM="Pseudopedinella elastica, Strain CCMP716" /LENGTH=372 /DNA_ID=CAMNT_0013449667 /DNA_START=76 /DNA_END=1194 /DNA_ORIENTATION=-